MKKLSAQYVIARQQFMTERLPMDQAQKIVAEYNARMKMLNGVHQAAKEMDNPREMEKAQVWQCSVRKQLSYFIIIFSLQRSYPLWLAY